jgi:DTW domain-containing protein YfiP
MTLVLLTHATEVGKPTNTGHLVQRVLGDDAVTVVWSRTQLDADLERRIEAGGLGLLWPSPDARPVDASSPRDYVLLDATWQQARKIYNRSPYLQRLETFALHPTQPSAYRLRRNQVEGGLCTIEAAAQLMTQLDRHEEAEALRGAFASFVGARG